MKRSGISFLPTDDISDRKPQQAAEEATYAFPLSFSQQRLWFMHQYEPNIPIYHTQLCLHLQGSLDVAALQYSLDGLISRHEILRTTFVLQDEEPVQIVSPADPGWVSIDLRNRSEWAHLPDAEKQRNIVEALHLERSIPFDLETGPLLRVTLIRIGPFEHVLQIVRHHIITDAWSGQIFWKELTALYNARIARVKS